MILDTDGFAWPEGPKLCDDLNHLKVVKVGDLNEAI